MRAFNVVVERDLFANLHLPPAQIAGYASRSAVPRRGRPTVATGNLRHFERIPGLRVNRMLADARDAFL